MDARDTICTCKDCMGEEIDQLRRRVVELSDFEELYQRVRDERDKLGKQVEELKETARWRKWPEERPEKIGCRYPYAVIVDWYPAQATFHSGRWFLDEKRSNDDITDKVTHFRPIGPMPEGVGDETGLSN